MAAAAYFCRTLHLDVFSVNPPLTRLVTGLTVLLCDPKYDWDRYSTRPQARCEWALGKALVEVNTRERARRCFVLGRWSLLPLLLLGGYCGYRLSRELHGPSAGLVFLILWCFSPLLLAWGATICPDAVAAALGPVAVYSLLRWLRQPGWLRAVIAGACLGLLTLSKLTWIIAFGLWPLVWCAWTVAIYATKAGRGSMPMAPLRQLTVILLLGLYTLNLGYLFDGTLRPLGRYVFISELFRGPVGPAEGNRFAGSWLGSIPVPFPADFIQGIDTQRYDFERGMPSYLRGQWADHGWWYYYLYALLVKEPLGTWYLAALAFGLSLSVRGYSAPWREEMAVLTPALAVFVFVSSQTGFSANSRYVLPAWLLFLVWVSKVGRLFESRPFSGTQRVAVLNVALALAWSVGGSLCIYPHSLSYFNELAAVLPTPADGSYPQPAGDPECSFLSRIVSAGPRNGPRHLLESNIDCGQDLFYLEQWCEAHPQAKPLRIACFGAYPLSRTNIESGGPPAPGPGQEQPHEDAGLLTFGPLPGWYALSVNEIYGRSREYRYFLNFRPLERIGYSICIYHITLEQANRVRRVMGLPELPRGWQARGQS